MELSPDTFRRVMGQFATGVTVVTTFAADGTALPGDNTAPPGDGTAPPAPPGPPPGKGAAAPGGGPGLRPQGITVNALSSVSLEPPLVMIAIDRRRQITPALRASGRFAVNILGEDQQALSDCFAGADVTPDRDAFCGAAWSPGPTGLPLLDGAIATLECTTTEVVSAGDHDLFIGRVDRLAVDESQPMPLLFFRRRYLRIERAATAAVEGRTG